ncbi:hypothetical protein [Neolewinella agarilytica]|uniref:Uncharacterized protein n=1 Tax=Neolewinella agarilytica TaxID=478744 RepID=A0A1H9KP62_9BACT|nr:hypothetical protein [Neolewinella agarilytica]SER00878.1 hypothetical protein SAMN05444359_12154 [Neolewinella agarilytica]
MSVFGDLKKLFFGAKSVAKHQASKAGEAAKDIGEDLKSQSDDLLDATKDAAKEVMDKAPEYFEKGKEALEGLTDKIWEEADSALDKGKELKDKASEVINEKLEDLRPEAAEKHPFDVMDEEGLDLSDLTDTPAAEAPKKVIDFESDVVEDTKAAAGKLADKAAGAAKTAAAAVAGAAGPALDAAAKAGAAAKDVAGDVAGKIGDVSEVVGAKVLEKGDEFLSAAAEKGADLKGKFDDFVDHANVEAEKMKLEDSIEAAKRAGEQAEARARAFDGDEASRNTSESILDGTDSFFDRAARFAEGDYHNEGGKEMTIQDNPDATAKPEGGLISGFLDSDGDGDSLIDDAIIEEE